MQMVSSIITLSFSTTGRWFTCIHDPLHSIFLSFLGGGGGGGIRTHEMHLSLCLVIDVIDFLIILESNIYHNQSDFLIHLTNEIMKHHFGELTTSSQGVQLYPGKVCCRPFF